MIKMHKKCQARYGARNTSAQQHYTNIFVSFETLNIVFGVHSKLKVFEICELATVQVRARYCCL